VSDDFQRLIDKLDAHARRACTWQTVAAIWAGAFALAFVVGVFVVAW
jgi:hypothetical protein